MKDQGPRRPVMARAVRVRRVGGWVGIFFFRVGKGGGIGKGGVELGLGLGLS